MPFSKLFALACLSVFAATPGFAVEAIVMPTTGDTCKVISTDRESSLKTCMGPAGYSLTYVDQVMMGRLAFGLKGKEQPSGSDDLSWRPSNEGIGSRIEWRFQNPRSVTAIISRWRNIEDSVRDRNVQELLVVKVTPNANCALGVVAALSDNAMRLARNIADERGPDFRCGLDRPTDASALDTSETSSLDGRFGRSEMLEHNGSIVELKRSRVGMIEIRYREPRAALMIEPGRLLFQGQEHNGRIEGRAFVFKSGCAPAGYDVTGQRTDGLLTLEGIAPRRGRDCAIIGASKTSPHARLTFNYEPVLDAATIDARRGLSDATSLRASRLDD